LEIWRDGFAAFRQSPLLGIGMDNYQEIADGYVAHNSFVQAFVELGFIGGTFFTSAFALGLWDPFRLTPQYLARLTPLVQPLRLCLLALLAGNVMGMMSSSRTYTVPTYMLLGLATVFGSLVTKQLPVLALRFDMRLAGRLAALSAGLL